MQSQLNDFNNQDDPFEQRREFSAALRRAKAQEQDRIRENFPLDLAERQFVSPLDN